LMWLEGRVSACWGATCTVRLAAFGLSL
jgi:hypothetical protein